MDAGRRRVGKSRLVQEFCDSTELPYLTEHDSGFASDLQKAWDRGLERTPVLLICVGSDVRMMEELVKARSPLHGRPTLELPLQPLSVPAVAQIVGANDSAEAIDRYLVVGGFPLLAARWPHGASMEKFLHGALVDDHAFVTTALRIMASELQTGLSARQVIEAIGHGETARGKIESRAGVKGNTLDDALRTLTDVKRMVERRTPYAVPAGTKFARYTIVDPYLRFWLRFIGPHMAEIARGRGDLTAARILRDWEGYRGRAVEPIVRGALERLLLEPAITSAVGDAAFVGSYWTRDNRIEVDLVGGNGITPTELAFVGSIKWHEREQFTAQERRALVAHRAEVPGAADARLVIVSRTGVEGDVAADLVLGPDEIVAGWT